MIQLTRLNGKPFTLNAQWIETIDQVPDTLITLTTGRKYMVREEPGEVRERCIEFFRACGPGGAPAAHPSALGRQAAGKGPGQSEKLSG